MSLHRALFPLAVLAGWGCGRLPAAVPVVTEGRAQAVIVTADHPGAVAEYAARELSEHVALATGVHLPVLKESQLKPGAASRIFVGDSKAAREAGIDPSQLSAETFVLRTKDNALFIAGNDSGGDPLDADTRAGTLWGVYEWLDRSLHARWLWPGELGTFVPKTKSVSATDCDETVPPLFFQRRLRPGLGTIGEHAALGFSREASEKYSREQSVFLRRHRMGRSFRLSYGHAFTDWWKKYGADHPDWFQLREDGGRGPRKSTSRYSMCVSNPEFQGQIVSLWAAKHKPSPGIPSFINACENDIPGGCNCDVCKALDGKTPADYLKFYSANSKVAGSRFVSDRYAHFWLDLQQLAAKTDPEANVIGYVYFNYFQAPTSGIKLNPHILLGFCPSTGWYPRSADEHEWMKRQWTGWRDTGARLFMRTNYLLDGYCMPFIFAHQFADDFQHAVREGMVASDFDSLTGQWATQGPTLYLAVRLHEKPEAPADELLAEYYSGFGSAAEKVKACFDYWENYTTSNRERITKTLTDTQTSRWRNWAKAAHLLYPPSCFKPAEAMLAEAARLAGGDAAASSRVQFLMQGLRHAQLSSNAAAELSLVNAAPAKGGATPALDELLAYRRAHEFSGISNFNHLSWVEDSSWNLPESTKTAPQAKP